MLLLYVLSPNNNHIIALSVHSKLCTHSVIVMVKIFVTVFVDYDQLAKYQSLEHLCFCLFVSVCFLFVCFVFFFFAMCTV